MPHKKKDLFIHVFRLVLGTGLAIYIIVRIANKTGISFNDSLNDSEIHFLLFALLLYGLIISLGSYRLRTLLLIQSVKISYLNALKLNLMGIFFSLAIPGAVSGDLVKFSLISKYYKDKKLTILFTLTIDRLFGLNALLFLTMLTVVVSRSYLLNFVDRYSLVQITVFIAILVCILNLFLVIALLFRQRLVKFKPFLLIYVFIKEHAPKFFRKLLRCLLDMFTLYNSHKKSVYIAFSVSLVIQILFPFCFLLILMGLGEGNIDIRHLFLATYISSLFAALPITPAGIGTRDYIVSIFFLSAGVPSSIAGMAPLVLSLMIVGYGLVGGIIFIFLARLKLDTHGHHAKLVSK